MSELFSDPEWVYKNVNPDELMWGLYWIAVGMQDIETPVSFMDLFTARELFDLWQCVNYGFYVRDSNYKGNNGLVVANARNLLSNIINTAEEAIASGKPSATLRFAEFYRHFADFKIAPMAGNVQMVFVRNKKNPKDVLVKIMLNEEDRLVPEAGTPTVSTWYRWSNLRDHYRRKWSI